MGYYYTVKPENVPLKFCATPKTHVPGSPVKERGFRYYSAESGRWVNRDPIAERGGLNLYLFTKGRPVALVDPRGLNVSPIYSGDIAIVENSMELLDVNSGVFFPAYVLGDTTIGAVTGNRACQYTFRVQDSSSGTIHFSGTTASAESVNSGPGLTLYAHEWHHADQWISTWNSYAAVANYYEGRKYCKKSCAELSRALVSIARKKKYYEWSQGEELWHQARNLPVNQEDLQSATDSLVGVNATHQDILNDMRLQCSARLFCD